MFSIIITIFTFTRVRLYAFESTKIGIEAQNTKNVHFRQPYILQNALQKPIPMDYPYLKK